MTRIVKEYDERYAEFVAMAQQLFFTHGYENTSVSDIVKALGVAQGTFYHYFESKTDVLTAIVKRMSDEIAVLMKPIITNENLSVIEKLEQFFIQMNQWGIAQKDVFFQLAGVIYKEENVLLREKITKVGGDIIIPLFTEILQQGIDDGVFAISYPFETAQLLYMMAVHYDTLLSTVLLSPSQEDAAQRIEAINRELSVLNLSLSRILGLAPDALTLFDSHALKDWFNELAVRKTSI